jgi:tellurite resistance protein
MCAYNDQRQVSSEELVQFLEAVAELKGEDSKYASFLAKTIMKFDKRRKDEKITKEEFISQCVLS